MSNCRSVSCAALICLIVVAGFALPAKAQTTAPDQWTWVSGSSTIPPGSFGEPGVYGTMGTPAAANVPGGREQALTWTDANGRLWLYGGGTFGAGDHEVAQLSDLWRFDPATTEWTWMNGSDIAFPDDLYPYFFGTAVYGTLGTPAPGNHPGTVSLASTWTDKNGNLWLFGGSGFDPTAGYSVFNALWEFNTTTNEWAWMGGSDTANQPGTYGTLGVQAAGNMPGARSYAISWVDPNGSFWLYGGGGADSNGLGPDGSDQSLDDVWEFNPVTNQWTWMAGSNVGQSNNPLVYGTLGIPAAANNPGIRYGVNPPATWGDHDGNLWLFGGNDYSDFWEFSISAKEWAWMGGSQTPGQSGVYGTLGVPAAGNIPGSRNSAMTWTDKSGNLWLFGGAIYGSSSYFDDVWVFTPSTNEWAWMGGMNSADASCTPYSVYGEECGWLPVYGTQGTPAPQNTPGARNSGMTWTDPNGNLWFFGGLIATTINPYDDFFLNDLWEYKPVLPPPAYPTAATPVFSPGSGTPQSGQSVTITDATPGVTIFYTTDGVTVPTTASTQYIGAFSVASNTTVQAIAAGAGYLTSAVASATYTVSAPPDFSVGTSPASLTLAPGQAGFTTLSVTPLNGFNSTVSFSCSNLPSGVSCAFVPATVTLSGLAATTSLTVSTTAKSTSASLRRTVMPGVSLAIAVCCLGWRRRRSWLIAYLALLSFAWMGLSMGCGGGSSSGSGGTPPGTSTITINATSGSLQHSTTLSLTVN